MVLPLPSRIPLFKAIVFAIAFMVLQIMEHTSPAFAMLHFAFIMISVIAFNVAGGMTSASGWYIFFFATLAVVVGTFAKALFGEAADATSVAPLLTMAAYTVGSAGILLAITASRALTRSTPSIADRMGARELNYTDASLGCTTLGMLIMFLRGVMPAGPGSIMSAVVQLDIFFPLAILLGTVAIVQTSHGRRSLGMVNVVPLLVLFFLGIITFSKQGMLAPFVCWLIGATYSRFRLRMIHFVFCVAFAILTMNVLYPIAQIGRNVVTDGSSMYDRILIVKDMVDNLHDTQKLMEGVAVGARESVEVNYFNHDVGLVERFTRWPGDDALIGFSAQGHYIGYRVITEAFLNWFPHFLLPEKEFSLSGYGGNYYVHEMGGLADDDTTTGISFSPVAEAFHVDGWTALTLVAPPIWFLLFLSVDLLCGDLRESPWGLFFALSFSHIAPESTLATVISFIWHGNLSLFMGMLFCINAAPFVGTLLTGAARRSRVLQAPSPISRMPLVDLPRN